MQWMPVKKNSYKYLKRPKTGALFFLGCNLSFSTLLLHENKIPMISKFTLLPLIAATVFSFSQNENVNQPLLTNKTMVAKKLPGTTTTTNIMAGQTIVAGTVTVTDDQDLGTLTVTYQLNNGWYMKEAHLHAGTVANIPSGNSGNPRIGSFAHKKTNIAAGTQTCTFVVPLSGLPTDVIILAAHASITGPSNETGWGQGTQINDGGSWAMRFDHVMDAR
jgi:hypothetical protein